MAMTNAQKNAVSEMQAMAALLIVARSKAVLLSEIYTNEGLASLTDADFADIAPFAHITAAEFIAAAQAIAASVTALNTGTPANWAKMLKITETMPK
jgi:hypothetical protein